MENKLNKTDIKFGYRILLEVVAVGLLSALIVWFYSGFFRLNLRAPINYQGDGLTGIVGIKEVIQGNTEGLGWPFHNDLYKYGARFDLLYFGFVKMLGHFTTDYVLILNLYVYTIMITNTLVSYMVIRALNVRRGLSYLCALTFGLCPYVQYRILGHFALSAVECIPLAFLITIWIYEKDDIFLLGKKWWKKRENVVAIVMAFCIANNGMVYYPFFSCFIILVAGIYKTIQQRNRRGLTQAIIAIGEIVAWLVIGFVPTVIGVLKGNGNSVMHGQVRNALRAAAYGLDLKSLFLSPKGYGSKKILSLYDYMFVSSSEQYIAYMGIAAIMGFIILLLAMLYRNEKRVCGCDDKIRLLSVINYTIVLLSVTGGIGVLVALFLPYISCYNRMGPYITFASVLTLALVMEKILKKCDGRRAWKRFYYILFTGILLFGLWEQQGTYYTFTNEVSENNANNANMDRAFFREVESKCKKDDMIFMLPYMQSFENGPVNEISDYDHYKGYLYTDTIRWSYGAAMGTENDQWYKSTSSLIPDLLMEELHRKGFAGIYINLHGYQSDEGQELLNIFCDLAECEDVVFDNEKMRAFISLDNYRDKGRMFSIIKRVYADSGIELTEEEIKKTGELFENGDMETRRKVFNSISDDKTTERFIEDLYKIFLGRIPSEEELNSFVETIQSGTDRKDIFETVICSDEFKRRVGEM